MFAQSNLSQGVEREICAVGRLGLEQLFDLLLGLEVQLALLEHLRIIEPSGVVVGRELEDCFEQHLSVAQSLALHCDLREQAHGLDVMAVREQECANDLLGPNPLTVGEQGPGGDDL